MARAKKKEGKSVIYTTEEEVGTPVQFPLFLPIEVRKSTLLIRPIMKALEKSIVTIDLRQLEKIDEQG